MENMKEYVNLYAYKDSFFLILTISFLLISILKSTYWKHTILLLKGLFYQRYSNQFLREDNVFTERVNIITSFILILNLSLLIAYFFDIILLYKLMLIIIKVTLFYLIKVVIIWLISKVFMLRETGKLAIFFSLLFDRAFGILIFPFLFFLYFFFFETVIISTLIIMLFITFFILKIFWLWKIGKFNFGFSHFYIFLYLCIVEIFPILLLVKNKI